MRGDECFSPPAFATAASACAIIGFGRLPRERMCAILG